MRDDIANGIFMRSLFADWPKDRLSQVYFPVAASYPPDQAFCHDTRRIGTSGRVRRYGPAQPMSTLSAPPSLAARMRPPLMNQIRIQLLARPGVYRWFKVAQEFWYANSWIGKSLENQLRDLRPDVVFALFGNYCLTKITLQACERLNIPFFAQITDDFCESLYAELPFKNSLQWAAKRWTRRAVAKAGGCAGIGPAMAEEYVRRYGNEWSWYTTLVDGHDYRPEPHRRSGPLQLVFTGNLGLGRWKTLKQIGLALEALRRKEEIDARLIIHTSAEQSDVHGRDVVVPDITELRGWVSPDQLPKIYHEADLLVHVESFDPAMIELTKFSVSTKISQYMMAGRCILAVGPEQLGSIRFVRDAEAGYCLGEAELSAPTEPLQRLLRDAERRRLLGANGRRWALEQVDGAAGRERFRRAMVDALHQGARRAA